MEVLKIRKLKERGRCNMKGKRAISSIVCILYMLVFVVCFTGCKNDVDNVTGNSSVKTATEAVNTAETKSDVTSIESNIQIPGKPVFTDEWKRNTIQLAYKAVDCEKKVKPYKVKSDLSNIENLRQFGHFTSEQKKMLAQNSFVVTSSDEEQLFYIYENNQYLHLPSFVTADSVLQVYHVFFDYSLRTLESQSLLEILEKLTSNMLKKSIYLYNTIKNPEVRDIALKNIAYFTVAQMALEKDSGYDVPQEARKLAEDEYKLITANNGFERSCIFPYKLDYSQFIPRGHYTRSKDLERYFRAMMWYGLAPFPLYSTINERNVEQTVQALLITYSVFLNMDNTSDIELWEKIYDPTVFYVGRTDDLSIYNYKDLLVNVYGTSPDLDSLMDREKIDQLYMLAEKLPEPGINAKWTSVDTPSGKQFRFMGQRYIPDSEILQELVEPIKRPMPSGLDVAGILGSQRAYDLLVNRYRVNEKWDEYPDAFEKLEDKFSKIPEEKWRSNMYYGWLWTLKSLLPAFGDGYPTFMTNMAWVDKSLNTALGSWAELRHDTILYGKQSGAECGDAEEPPVVKSYVEPNIELYNKLFWLTCYSRENLKAMKILPEDMETRMQRFEELLQFLITCSVKELRNEELTREEYNMLLIYGGTLEFLTSSMVEGNARWFEITSDTDKNMAVIADVHTVPGWYLEAGVGPAAQIFVVVPIGGKLYLTRGAVFSYYEFVSDKRLTDEEWQVKLKEGKQPPRPEWVNSFEKGVKGEIPVPEDPYESCK